MKQTIRAKLVAICDGIYTNYVFQNLHQEETSFDRYITATKCPNWQFTDKLSIGDVGFLEFENVNAGDSYKDISTGKMQEYNYTTTYFMNFIKEKQEMKENFNF